MTDTKNKDFELSDHPALSRFRDQLIQAGVDDSAIGFLLGRMMRLVDENIMVEVKKSFSENELKMINTFKSNEKKGIFIERTFLKRKGQSLADYRNELLEKIVKDFEDQK